VSSDSSSVIADLVIRGGVVYTSSTHFKADIGIRAGKIAWIDSGEVERPADRVVDARGLAVLPGVWHPHCHFRDPGHTQKEDFESGTRAAVAGGITFCVDQSNTSPPPVDLATFEQKRANAEAKAHIDFGLNGAGLHPENVAELASAGAMSIKIFNTRHPKDVYPYLPELSVIDHALLFEIYEAAAAADILVSVHHDDADWNRSMVKRDYLATGRVSNRDYMDAYEKGYMYGHGMVAGLAASLYYARLAGIRLYILHLGVMPVGAYELIRHAKQDLGQTVYGEMEATAMFMSREQAEKIGPFTYLWAHSPQAAWQALLDGTSDTVVVEHAPHARDEVEPGWEDNFSVPLGITGVQEFLPLMLTAVNEGRLSMEDLVRLTSENPAKIFGLYPRKGTLTPGADGDLTLVDMNQSGEFADADMESKTGLTSWTGMKFTGKPVYTISRGSVVMDHGKILSQPGDGHFVPGAAAR
jgi:dihydroorotase-like cyclic amidohydrolase